VRKGAGWLCGRVRRQVRHALDMAEAHEAHHVCNARRGVLPRRYCGCARRGKPSANRSDGAGRGCEFTAHIGGAVHRAEEVIHTVVGGEIIHTTIIAHTTGTVHTVHLRAETVHTAFRACALRTRALHRPAPAAVVFTCGAVGDCNATHRGRRCLCGATDGGGGGEGHRRGRMQAGEAVSALLRTAALAVTSYKRVLCWLGIRCP